MTEIAQPQQDPGIEARMAALENGSGYSSFVARSRHEEQEDEAVTVVSEPSVETEKPRTPHYSRRGGRSYPEDSDSRLDQYWQVTDTTPLSAEQLASNASAYAELQVGFDVAESLRADEVAKGAKSVADAIVRARREKRDRERAARGLPPVEHASDETIEALKTLK